LRFGCAFLAVILCASLASADVPDQTPIRIGAALDDQTTPLLWAVHSGMFKRAGLNVEVQRFTSGSAVAAAVAGGALEMGKAGTMAIVTAHAHGLPFSLIAPVAYWRNEAPDNGIVVASGSPIKNARDFNGKTIAVSSIGDLYTYAAQAWIAAGGGDPKSVKFVEVPPPSVSAAIDAGRIDGGEVGEPVLSPMLATGKYRLAAPIFDAVGHHWDVAGIFAKDDWLASHRSLVERFVRVIHDANAYVASHENEASPLIVQFVGLEQTTVSHMQHPGRSLYLDPAAFQPAVDLAANYGAIAKNYPAAELISPYALKPPTK
jgi:NitT/TauT family transport system substrate-binding protein